jgi:voltage-gated potassium channel
MLSGAVVILLMLGGLLALSLAIRRLVGRQRLYEVIFEAETSAGRGFDVLLLLAIAASVVAVILESDPLLKLRWAVPFQRLEWLFTLLFSLEYLLRLCCVRQPLGYARSFFGLVDLLAIAPSFLGLLVTGTQTFLVVRVLRLLRVFRVFKLGEYLHESELLWTAIRAARRKISVFLLAIVALVTLIGALMYVIEGPLASDTTGFRSIAVGIYWAIVTITTVGYGDLAPVTPLGRLMASVVMLLGYSIIAVPTGILSAEIGTAASQRRAGPPPSTRVCPSCHREGHDLDARHCKSCGAEL